MCVVEEKVGGDVFLFALVRVGISPCSIVGGRGSAGALEIGVKS